MANYCQRWFAAAVVAVLVAVAAAQSPSGSSGDIPSCASKLAGCAEYINATKTPPASCCNPLKEAVTNERDCLCNIYSNPSLLAAFNINITQAMNLPKLCKIDTGKDADICKGRAPSPSSSTPSPPGGSRSGSGSNDNAADKITRAGLVSSFLVFATYMLFY